MWKGLVILTASLVILITFFSGYQRDAHYREMYVGAILAIIVLLITVNRLIKFDRSRAGPGS